MPEFIGQPVPSGPASTGLKSRRFVQMSTAGVLRYPTNGTMVDGVLFADSSTGSTRDVSLGVQILGIAEVEAAGGTLHVGQFVAASSVGRAITWTTGKICVGKVWSGSSGTTGRILSVHLNQFAHSTAIT
jgi:hypothetical protein